jgi:hypothetical protein
MVPNYEVYKHGIACMRRCWDPLLFYLDLLAEATGILPCGSDPNLFQPQGI